MPQSISSLADEDIKEFIEDENWEGLIGRGSFIPGITPLMLAICSEDYTEGDFKQKINMIKYLLDNGANINKKDKFGNTALHYAVLWLQSRCLNHGKMYMKGHIDVINELINNPKSKDAINFNPRNIDNETPIDLAKKYGLTEIYEMLLVPAMEQAKIKKHLTQVPEKPALPKEIVEEIYKKFE